MKEEKLENVDNRTTRTIHQEKIGTQDGLQCQIRRVVGTHKITVKIHLKLFKNI